MKEKRLILPIRENKNKQRRVTIPKKVGNLKDGDLVEVRKVEIR